MKTEERDAQLNANEQGLVDTYRENLCHDEECEGMRFSAALTVLRGAKEHCEVGRCVSDYMHKRSDSITTADLGTTSHLNTEPNERTNEMETKDEERCPDCGQTPEEGACFHCKMD